jgi:hypothetical protein
MNMAGINDLANSIAQMEGFNTPGTIAARNNNPGNLRYAPTQVGSENTVNGVFATFASPADGWLALQNYINTKANQGTTLRNFIYTYAPPSENNTSSYLDYLVGSLGIGADQSLSDLVSGSPNVDTSSPTDIGSSLSSMVSDISSNSGLGIALLVGVAFVAIVMGRD